MLSAGADGREGMRVGEVLMLKARGEDDRTLTINSPKSGHDFEIVFMPKKVAERLENHISSKESRSVDHILSIGYTGRGVIVKKTG